MTVSRKTSIVRFFQRGLGCAEHMGHALALTSGVDIACQVKKTHPLQYIIFEHTVSQ
jgi:hypothetical protein